VQRLNHYATPGPAKKCTKWKIPWKKSLVKIKGVVGKHQEGLLVAAEYKRMEEASRGQG